MKSLDSIREEVAIREGFDSWDALILAVEWKYVPVGVLDVLITDIATMYAEEALDEAADKVELCTDEDNPYRIDDYPFDQRICLCDSFGDNVLAYIDRDSILSIKNQLK